MITAPQKLRPYGGIEMCLLLLLLEAIDISDEPGLSCCNGLTVSSYVV